jgi:hypothetical protein
MGGNLDYAAAGYELSLLLNNQSSGDSSTLVSDITNDINTNFNSAFGGAETSSDGVVTYGRMVGRNMSLSKAASNMTDENNSKHSEAIRKRDTYTRQGEINEWQAQNKLDTLFFLQILFIFLAIVIFLLFLRQGEILNDYAIYLIVGVLLLVVVAVLWNRASYTAQTRDKRYWNRRYIGLDDSNLSSTSQCSP